MVRLYFICYFILNCFCIKGNCQKYFMKTFDMNNNGLYGESTGSSVLSKDSKFLFSSSVHYKINNNKTENAVLDINRYEFVTGKIIKLDSVYIPNKGIGNPLSWRGGLIAISDTSYVMAYQNLDTFNKNRLDFKIYTELYCFTDKGDSLWTYTYTGTDSLTYLSNVYANNNIILLSGSNYYKRNSLECSGFLLAFNNLGSVIFNKSFNEIKGGINSYGDIFNQKDTFYICFSSLTLTGIENEGKIYKFINLSIVDSFKITKGNYNSSLLRILKISSNEITYLGMWDTAYPYDPKLKDALHYVLYVAKVDMSGNLIGRYFLDDGVKQNFFNALHAIQQKNGNYLIMVNEDSKLPENDYGNVNIGLYCMSPNGAIKWKRKYYTHRRPQNDTYSSDLVLNQNDDIFITGYANNMYDTTDMEWDILMIAADSNGCITGMDCENFYTSTVSINETPQPIPWVVYPNPSSGRFTILLSTPTTTNTIVQITDMSGKTVWQEKIEEGTFDIPVSIPHAKAGIYSLQLMDDTKQIKGRNKIWIE